MLEKELIVRVRKEDLGFVNKIVHECEEEYHDIMLRETNEEYTTKLTVLQD